MNKTKALFKDSESLIIFGIIIGVTILVAILIRRYLQNKIAKRLLSEGADITSFLFIRDIVTYTIYLLGFGWAFLSLPISSSYAHSLFAGAGASTLILGFAAQQVLSNFMSGVFVILKRPFKVSDIIEISGNKGVVKEINLHETILEKDDKTRIIIPNSLVSNAVIIHYYSP